MLTTLKEKRLVVPTLMTLAALPILLWLGSWQLARKEWKEELLKALEVRAVAAPLSEADARALRCAPSERAGVVASCDYRRVRLTGTFDHAAERHIFAGVQRFPGGQAPGYYIFTPFRPSAQGGGNVILVNRGFVPEALKSPESRAAGQVAGEVEITAHVRSREPRRWSDADNDPAKNTYYVRDPAELGLTYEPALREAPLLETGWLYLELVDGAPPGGYPVPLAGAITLPNRHMEYALTWFGLAAALAAIYAVYAASRLRS